MGGRARHFHRGDRAAFAAAEQRGADQQDYVHAERAGAKIGFGDGGSIAEFGGGDERSGEGKQIWCGRRGCWNGVRTCSGCSCGRERSEERRVGKECRSRWSAWW